MYCGFCVGSCSRYVQCPGKVMYHVVVQGMLRGAGPLHTCTAEYVLCCNVVLM